MVNNTSQTSGESGHPMDFLLTEEFNLPVAGETRKGWVISHHNNEILVDIGAKSEGIIKVNEVQNLDDDSMEILAVGNEVIVYVVSTEDAQGNVIVSYQKAAAQRDWQKMETLADSKEVCQGEIVGHNKGGLLVQVGHLRGFVPKSQFSRDRQISSSQTTLQKAVGHSIKVKVLEVDPSRNRLILSEKAASNEIRQEKRAEILESISTGDIFDGRVINLADFGAFVDIGGIEGLVHLSEISWKRINNPADVLEVGADIKVQVISVDRQKERLALSLKRLQDDPWTNIEESYQIGQLMEATVTKVAPYGAFARLNDDYELEGLIHISELSEEHVEHPNEVVKLKQVVTIRIIRIDQEQRQLGLSIKQVASPKFVESDLAMMTQ